MQGANSLLMDLFEGVPADLNDYFSRTADGSFHGDREPRINLLSIAEAVQWTNDFREFQPTVIELRGVILDDPDTSNHHVYLSASSCAGSVLYLNHDGDSRIVFRTLADFVLAARKAADAESDICSFHPDGGIILDDQRGLCVLISELYEERNERDTAQVVVALIPSMDLMNIPLLERIAADADIEIAEALAISIASRPRPDLEPVSIICREHPHVQVSRAGARALAAIQSLK